MTDPGSPDQVERRRRAAVRLQSQHQDAAAKKAEASAAWQVRHDAELEERRAEKAAERERRRRSWQTDPSNANTSFDSEMATRLGISLAELRELKASRREGMKDKPQISYSPDHKTR